MAYASQDKPGIAILNKENLESAIAEARQVSDVVIAMPHWGPEDVAIPTGCSVTWRSSLWMRG